MISRSRQLLTNYIVKRPYWTPNITNTNNIQGFIDYEKYLQDVQAKDKQINDVHMYYKHLSNVNAEQTKDIRKILCNVSEISQSINEQKYWIFHSVLLSYVGLFTYIFKL
jgi:hypothetical protein